METDFFISRNDWNKIINYARAREQQCGDEIGGMAIAKETEDGDWVISEPTILEQTTTGGTCTLDKEALSEYYIDMAMKHGTDIQFVWWHSHAKMGAFWSGTDTNTMTEYKSGNWSMFLVVNVYEQYKFRVQVWKPFEAHMDIDLEILDEEEFKVPKRIVNEVEKKCSKEPTIVTKPITGYNYNAYQRNLFQHEVVHDVDSLLADVDVAEYNTGYGIYGGLDIEESPVAFLLQQIELGNTRFIEGSCNYLKYKAVMEEFNETLRKLTGPKVRVTLFSEDKLMDTIMTSHPEDFITIDGKELTELRKDRGERL